jgi:hypothetical protein
LKYALLIHWNEAVGARMTPADQQAAMAAHGAFRQALGSRLLAAQRLQSAKEATCVQVRDGERLTTDGPFAEAKEVLGGFYLIECASRAEAVDWAGRCPSATHGTIEVRPVWET